MSKQLSLDDFRAVRVVLEPDDFAITDGYPDRPPSDLISKEIWFGIMDLPDDVAVRTSSHNGQALGDIYRIWGDWIGAIGDPEHPDPLFEPMLDAADDLKASIFDALHGFYRTAFSALRNVLELMTIGTCGSLNNSQQYKDWRNGTLEFKFGAACDQLSKEQALRSFNEQMTDEGQQPLWDPKSPTSPGGYCRSLYRDLCNYAHSRPGFTDADLRRSNGPIYVPEVFWEWHLTYLRVISLGSVMAALARPHGDIALLSDLYSNDPNVLPPELLKAGALLHLA
ncbi:MAG TPA: hypothetical protein VGT04_00495 [Acidobacteriaceae bacterium]|nr:hypothetical protein [Acidobacteriaceae bacterium]